MLQLKDGICIDYQQSEKMKVGQDNFDQAFLDVKPVNITVNTVNMYYLIQNYEARHTHVAVLKRSKELWS